ncbi:MAG TPA: hypothetical protein VMC08_01615, partial [Bacteroidales bacterium]|nr:hypothetical protein [Bacteroidales bacterium]
MKKMLLLLGVLFTFCTPAFSQVGVGTETPDPSSMLDVSSSAKGMLIPRMTLIERDNISEPATGLLVFQTDGVAGFYYNRGTPGTPDWAMVGGSGASWLMAGNPAVNSYTSFVGTLDDSILTFRIRNLHSGLIDSAYELTGLGYRSLGKKIGAANTALGFKALNSLTGGYSNTALGSRAMQNSYNPVIPTMVTNNTAVGFQALQNAMNGDNTALGESAARNTQYGTQNVSVGNSALWTNINGSGNTAVGYQSMHGNTASNNTGFGAWTLHSNGTGNQNTALGYEAMYLNTTGHNDVALGIQCLYNNNGNDNTAVGHNALFGNTAGNENTAVGGNAFQSDGYNNSTAIGYNAQVSDDNQVRLGDGNITSLVCMGAYAATTASAPNLYVAPTGQIFRSTVPANNHSQYTPTGSDDTNGNIGDIVWNDNFIYVKTNAGW